MDCKNVFPVVAVLVAVADVHPGGAVDDMQQPVALGEWGDSSEVAAVDSAAEGCGVAHGDRVGERCIVEEEEAFLGIGDHQDHAAEIVLCLERDAHRVARDLEAEGVDARIADAAAARVGRPVGAEQHAVDLGGVARLAKSVLERREGLCGRRGSHHTQQQTNEHLQSVSCLTEKV